CGWTAPVARSMRSCSARSACPVRTPRSSRSTAAPPGTTATPSPPARPPGSTTVAVERAQPSGLPGFDDGIALADLLAALPDERREAFVLTQVLELPYEDAARLTACPVGTVRSRVARARATLVELLMAAEVPRDPAESREPTALAAA
ncbi:hypothetical protein CTU88_47885, partial [Streptomyces sp. JV178]